MILPMVCWSNACEVGMIGTMRVSSFQSRLVNRSFYFAQELISLSNLPYRLFVSRNYFLPSLEGLKPAVSLLVFARIPQAKWPRTRLRCSQVIHNYNSGYC